MVQIYKAPLSNIKYAYVETLKQCKKLFKKLDIPFENLPAKPAAAHTQTLTLTKDYNGQTVIDCVCIVWLIPSKNPTVDIPLLVHEATHIKQEIELWMSEDKFSPEVEAYIMQGIAENLLREYNTLRGG